MTELPKGICPFCRRTKSLRADGRMRSHGQTVETPECLGTGQKPYLAEQPKLPPMIRGLIAPEQKYKLLADLDTDIWLILQKRYDDNADVSVFKEPLEIIALCQDIKQAIDWQVRLAEAVEHVKEQNKGFGPA